MGILILLTFLYVAESFQNFQKIQFHYRKNILKHNNLLELFQDFPISSSIAASVTVFGLAKLTIYWKMQFITASTIAGIPNKSKVVDLDVQDGKNIFYLSNNCIYTAIMPPGDDPSKRKDKMLFNERVILESIGKANINGLGLQGKVRSRSQEISSRDADCVLSVGALSRSKAIDETLQEVSRILKPGGLFVFVEPTKGISGIDVLSKIQQVFPEQVKVSIEGISKRQNKNDPSIETTDTHISSSSSAENESNRDNRKRSKKNLDNQKGFKSRSPVWNERSDSSYKTSVNEKTLEEENIESQIVVDKENSSMQNSSSYVMKPGLIYETHNNIIDSYISGIGIRPY